MPNRALFDRFEAARQIPLLEFADLPTPVGALSGLAKQLGLRALHVKRDDLSATQYGGNKVRKLEFLLADARARGFEKVWTVGGIGSHHCLATCIWARHLGMDCGVLQFPQPTTPHVQRNIRALSTTRPDVHLLAREDEQLTSELFARRLRAWHDSHPHAYYIPGGGSSPLGALGYVNAALELVAQVEAGEAPRPDLIVVAAGTCGTLSGLLLGFQLAAFDVEVRGVRVVDSWIADVPTVVRLAEGAAALLADVGVPVPRFDTSRVHIDDRFFGPAYGVPTVEGLAARETVAASGGLTLEPTYTAKAFASIIADATDLADRGQRVLYWHTLSGADLSDRLDSSDLDALPPAYRRWATSTPHYEDG